MSGASSSPDSAGDSDTSGNFCYRHPDRQSFILCQRCGRTICPECQTQAPVGVHCPECVREARQSAPRTKPAVVTAINRARRGDGPIATYSIIGVTVAIWLLQMVTSGTGAVTGALLYWAPYTEIQPWRMITTMFVHSEQSFLHILFNMYSLWIFGRILEHMIGRGRFLALYFLSGIGGSIAVLLLAPATPVIGASGAIFGLLGAFFVIQRGLGGNSIQLVVVIGINLVIGFVVPGIAWQAHIGGLIVGALVAFIFMRTRRRDQRSKQLWMLGAVLAGLVVLTVVGVLLLHSSFA
ncbi:membrane associated rhomboid family serine protease [Homoserinimonas aerilata]|uniref:Membrane associated rhomboid family serine protease n=1 Tax=Homoserinimonas aerilata TaxID=1162970 RepID=A0A542YEP0_9MICO|nr:rhomboid family intramembrane serine protease [Homoserinimonas aerilata]TQL46531.1 membrane associated rhomboid family serine protease [Homoserinimonas aerilata]